MKQFLINFKNYTHFIKYGVKHGSLSPWSFCINSIILIYAITQWENIIKENNIILLIFLIFVNFVWQIISTSKDLYQYLKKTNNCLVSHKNINSFKLSDDLSGNYTQKEFSGMQVVIINNDVNQILESDRKIKIKVSRRKKQRVDHYIKTYFNILYPFLQIKWYDAKNRNGAFYNEKKLCMASEIEECENGDFCVALNEGNYYNSFLTNNIFCMKMSNQNGVDIMPPLNIDNSPIRSLNTSCLSNHIGISTIAVTSDGYAVIMRHNNKSAIDTNKLMPTASGSVDYADMIENEDFRKTIIRAVEREFCEETTLKHELIFNTKILGFYRDLSSGGKPEFCCLTTLRGSRFDINELIIPNSSEQRDDFEMIRIFENGKYASTAVQNFLRQNNYEISLALNMNIELLPKLYAVS